MKKENKCGFTLVELLAVIVVLAVIALITTPMILGVIEKSKIGAAESSAHGYIEGVHNLIIEKNMDREELKDGNYIVTDPFLQEVKLKGNKPTEGKLTIEKGKVVKGELCINGYSIQYKEGKTKYEKEGGYCKGNYNYKVSLNVLGSEVNKQIGVQSQTTFEVDRSKEKEWTNLGCNKGAIPSYENGIVTIRNISDDTVCKITNSLKETIDQADESLNTIVLLQDEVINERIVIQENQNIHLELMDKSIESTIELFIQNFGRLVINSNDGIGKIIGPEYLIWPDGNSITELNGGTYIATSDKKAIIGNWFENCSDISPKLTVNHATLTDIDGDQTYFATAISNHCGIDVTLNDATINVNGNSILTSSKSSKMNVNHSTLQSRRYHTIQNLEGTTVINNSEIILSSEDSIPVVQNQGGGTLTLKGDNKIERIAGVGKEGPIFINRSTGKLIIQGGSYIQNMENPLLINASVGTVMIHDGTYINHNSYPIIENQNTGSIYMCGGSFQGGSYHFSNRATGNIFYKENVIFKNPVIPNVTGNNIVLNSTIACSW